MGQLQPLLYVIVLLASLIYSKYTLEKAGLQLQEKERIQANKLLKSAMVMNVLIILAYITSMCIAGTFLAPGFRWIALLISAVFAVCYILINNKLYKYFNSLGFTSAFSNMFVQSRVILLIGLLVFAHYLYNTAQTFAKP